MKNYYVYSHIRNDTNSPFYIGKGTKKLKGQLYARAFCKLGRNKFWRNITNKTTYIVNIEAEFETEEEALDFESKLIEKYGMVWNRTGVLCNIEPSGVIQKCSDYKKSLFEKPVYKYEMCGTYLSTYKSYTEAAILNNVRVSDIGRCVKGLKRSIGNFQWSNILSESIDKARIKRTVEKEIIQLDLDNNFIKTWPSASNASKILNISRSSITNCLLKISKTAGNYKWEYNG